TISRDAVQELAREFSLSLGAVEIAALKAQVIPERYLRNLNAYSLDDQIRLLESCVAIVGLGGLGGLVFELLVRAGVGKLRVADGDTFEASNLNRQMLGTEACLGQNKAKVAMARAKELNPGVEVHAVPEFLDRPSMDALIQGADVVVDCLGGLKHRNMLRTAAREAGKPLVTAAVAGLTGLAATLLPGPDKTALLFPENPDTRSAEDELGCPGPGVNLASSLQASMVMNLLCNSPGIDGRSVLFFDLKDFDFSLVRI
ncbi:MAG: HesA/MoeB/ThiF family protein, partial [Desulfovibrio sp.]